MNIPIKLKVTIFIISSFVIILGSFFYFNQKNQTEAMTSLYDANTESIQYALSENIELIMISGENENIQPAIDEFTKRGIVEEVSVINADQIVTRSTDISKVDKKSNDSEWTKLFKTGQDFSFEKEIDDISYIYSYKIYNNTGVCNDCHDIDSEKILGGMKIVKSKGKMVESINASTNMMLIFGFLGGLLIISGILFYLNREIFTPIKSVKEKLSLASQGDINQDIKVRTHDEIGVLLQAIKDLIEYNREIAKASERIANGNLLVEIEPKSENDLLGKSFKIMINNLNTIIQKLIGNTEQLTSVSEHITSSSEESSRGAKEQTSQVNQIATAIEEMSATIVETTRNTADASQMAQESSTIAAEGQSVVSETINGMQTIANVVRGASDSIGSLASSAEKIGDIISVIDDIADQTNLLALNAAIEAARAGEQGRGFAVVADEVRKLAERTGKATGEITDMIKEIQDQTQNAVTSMESGIIEVDKGRELTDKAGTTLSQIVEVSKQVTLMIEQIATASEQQAATSEEVAKSIEHIYEVTQESQKAFEQTASSADQLNVQADELKEIVRNFEV